MKLKESKCLWNPKVLTLLSSSAQNGAAVDE